MSVVNGFAHVALRCKDIDKSIEMYKSLGLKEVIRWGEGEKLIVMLEMPSGDRIELFANGGDFYSENGKWQHFAVSVDNVEAAYNAALEAGFKSQTPPKIAPLDSKPYKTTLNVAFVTGNDNESLEFFKELR
ncbi:MAG: VOC family protein [Clostridia bacterium]|nr:VOC family protein [Clostridia bacterium]